MKDKAKLEAINHFFKVHGCSTEHCLEPTEKCELKAIRAHSIPNGAVMDKLAQDGHVIMPQMKLKMPPPAEINFKRVGRNKATTFSGLCAKHDNNIFQPIDDNIPNLNDKKHLFLMAYRAVLREYHAVLQNAIRFQSTYQKRVEVGLSPGTEPCNFGMFATAHISNAFECNQYKRTFDDAFLMNDWSKFEHHILILKNQSPSIAVSSLFSIDTINAPDTPRVALSLYPVKPDVVVIFSSTKNDAPFVDAYLNRIVKSEAYYQKYLLSKLILQCCDNFVISPQYYKSMSHEQKKAIRQFFINTLHYNNEGHEDEYLYLF